MASTLTVTKQLSNEKWVITAAITPGGTLPPEIFVYENTGTTDLGAYAGVVSVIDMARIQVWHSIVIPAFGNNFVRHSVATLYVDLSKDVDAAIATLKGSIQLLSKAYQATQSSTQIYTIT